MFDFRPTTNPLGNLSGDELEAAWKDWARKGRVEKVQFVNRDSFGNMLT